MKRVIAVFLAVVMLLSFAACAKTDDETKVSSDRNFTTGYDETKYNAPGEFPEFKKTQTITVMLPDSTMVEDWETNFQTIMTERDLNCELIINALPSKEYKTKVNLMVAAGGDELSDAVLGSFSDEAIQTYADSDILVPLTEYYYNTDISYFGHEAMERLGWDYLPQITMPDGEIYYIPRINDSISNVNPDKMWMFGPWCEQLGIDVDSFETRDDFKAALTKIVTSDPNGNGKADEIGIASASTSNNWFSYIMNTFVYAGDANYMVVEDGELSYAFTTDKWKEGLEYIKGMYDEGLISPLSFSQDSAAFTAMINSETTIVGAFASMGTGGINETDERRVQYEAAPPLASDANGGERLASYVAPTADGRFFVSKKAADPETVFRFGDYMTSEKVSIHTRWGEEGVDWLQPAEDDISLYSALGYPAFLKEVLVWSTVQNKHWSQTGPYIRQKTISAGVVWSGNPLDHSRVAAEAQLKYEGVNPDEYITKLIYTEEESEIVSEAQAGLIEYVDEMTAKFITGAEDIESGWDAFRQQIEKMGRADILECAQAAYDRMNSK